MLALAILIRYGVTPCATNTDFFYVKKGLAPLSMIFFGYYEKQFEDPRTAHAPKKHAAAMAPLLEEMHARLALQGAPQRAGYNTVNRKLKKCTCSGAIYRGEFRARRPASLRRAASPPHASPDSAQFLQVSSFGRIHENKCWPIRAGSSRGGCECCMAVELYAQAPDTKTAAGIVSMRSKAIVDFGSMISAREQRVPRDAQLEGVRHAKDALGVWNFVSTQSEQRGVPTATVSATAINATTDHQAAGCLATLQTELVDDQILEQEEDAEPEEESSDACEASAEKRSKKEGAGVRRGVPRAIEPKKRHEYRGGADKLRPQLGYKCGVRARTGHAAIHQTDASRAVRVDHKRVSRISRVAALKLRKLATKARADAAASKASTRERQRSPPKATATML